MFTDTYPNHFEDFASDNASKLDVWVFDRVKVKTNKLYVQKMFETVYKN